MFRYDAPEAPGKGRRVVNRVLLSIFAVCIPFSVLAAADNVLFRLPYFFQYECDRAIQSGELELQEDSKELGALLTDYLKGGQTELTLKTQYRGTRQEVFGAGDQIAMDSFRKALNRETGAGIVCALIGAAAAVYFIRKDYKEAVRIFFRGGTVVFAVLCLAGFLVLSVPAAQVFLHDLIFRMPFTQNGVLTSIMSAVFFRDWLIARTVVALAVLICLRFVVWSHTKPRMMFW